MFFSKSNVNSEQIDPRVAPQVHSKPVSRVFLRKVTLPVGAGTELCCILAPRSGWKLGCSSNPGGTQEVLDAGDPEGPAGLPRLAPRGSGTECSFRSRPPRGPRLSAAPATFPVRAGGGTTKPRAPCCAVPSLSPLEVVSRVPQSRPGPGSPPSGAHRGSP